MIIQSSHLLTHVLIEAPLTKTNFSGDFSAKSYCKVTTRDLLIFSSKTNADLNFKKPRKTISISSIKSVELMPARSQLTLLSSALSSTSQRQISHKKSKSQRFYGQEGKQ